VPIPEHHQPTPPTPPAVAASSLPRRSAVVRSADIAGRQVQHLLSATPNAPFFFVYDPETWCVAEEGLESPTWLPDLAVSRVIPGVNNYRTRPKNAPDSHAYEEAHRTMQRRGQQVILWDAAYVRLDDGSISCYLVQVDAKDPRTKVEGPFYMDAWDIPRSGRRGKRIKFNRDRAGYNRWLLFLVESGVIGEPNPDIVGLNSDLVKNAEGHLDRKLAKVDVTAEVRDGEVKAQTAKVERLRNARMPKLRRELVGVQAPPLGYRGFGRTAQDLEEGAPDGE